MASEITFTDRNEVGRAMTNFGSVLNGLGKRRAIVEPPIPDLYGSVQQICLLYDRGPTASLLLAMNEMGKHWPDIARSYLESLKEYEGKLSQVDLPENKKDALARGYAALKIHTNDLSERVDRFAKIHKASVFAESKLDEFRRYVAENSTQLNRKLQEKKEAKGGIITYSDGKFSFDYRPNAGFGKFKDLISSVEEGDRDSYEKLYQFVNGPLKKETEKAYRLISGKEAEKRFLPILRHMEMLKEHDLTDFLESYLHDFFRGIYTHDSRVAFSDESLFSEGSGNRLFAHFDSSNSPRMMLAEKIAPAREDAAISWEIGPNVTFYLPRSGLSSYMFSRGKIEVVGSYSPDEIAN